MRTLILVVGCGLGLVSCSPNRTDEAIVQTACLSPLPGPVSLPGGEAIIGSNQAYLEERPQRSLHIKPFSIDATEVTNADFAAFIRATGYVTEAEQPQPGFNVPGGAVFMRPSVDHPSWWRFVEGASWRHPEGPGSHITNREQEPVVQVTIRDARAYADWAGRRLPTEAEWEYAARAGSRSTYIWGEERNPDDEEKANIWQGAFPLQNSEDDGYRLRAPVGCFAPNDFGLYDMIGNVWEWTDSEWDAGVTHVIKGGSFLCAENYCRRYRASARQPQENTLSTNHIGFRTVKSTIK